MEEESIFKLRESGYTAKQLSCSIIQAGQMLAMMNAELVRVLKLQCTDIGCLAEAKTLLEPNTKVWNRALRFIHLYNLMYDMFSGDAVAIRHWLRSENNKLQGVPLLIIIDEHRIEDVIRYFS